MGIKKVDICIKVVCNHYCFYNFIFKRERAGLCFSYVIYCWLKKKMYNKYGHVCKEIINVVGNSKDVL